MVVFLSHLHHYKGDREWAKYSEECDKVKHNRGQIKSKVQQKMVLDGWKNKMFKKGYFDELTSLRDHITSTWRQQFSYPAWYAKASKMSTWWVHVLTSTCEKGNPAMTEKGSALIIKLTIKWKQQKSVRSNVVLSIIMGFYISFAVGSFGTPCGVIGSIKGPAEIKRAQWHSLRWLFIRGHLYFLNWATALLRSAIISSCRGRDREKHALIERYKTAWQ